MTDAVSKGRIRLGRLLEAAAANVVQPAVHWTPNAAILDPPVCQRDKAVGAVQPDQPRPALLIAEEDQVFAHDPDLLRLAARVAVLRQPHRPPVAPQEFAAGRPR